MLLKDEHYERMLKAHGLKCELMSLRAQILLFQSELREYNISLATWASGSGLIDAIESLKFIEEFEEKRMLDKSNKI